MTKTIIAPSILAANYAHLGDDAKAVLNAGADWLHFDVMDNHYVPNLSIGPMVCQALRDDGITAPIDVHLMAKPVDSLIPAFAQAGATSITIHPETTEHLDRSLSLIKELGCKAGLAFNPSTPLSYLDYTLDKLDIVLIMSVNPGFGGQSFLRSMIDKIRAAHAVIKSEHPAIHLAVDGGINADNITEVAEAGADTFIAGSAIFGQKDYAATIAKMRRLIAPL